MTRRRVLIAAGGSAAAAIAATKLARLDSGDTAERSATLRKHPQRPHQDHPATSDPSVSTATTPTSAPERPAEPTGHASETERAGEPPPRQARWSDAETWGGTPPGPRDVARIDQTVLLDVDARVAGVVIGPAGSLQFDPRATRTLRSSGNVIVSGTLQMRPATTSFVHTLVFTDVDERRFVGGGMDPLDTDVGLWVVGTGQLDLVGSPKTAWTTAKGTAGKGQSVVDVSTTTEGWQPGDEVVVTPTLPPAVKDHVVAFDRRPIVLVADRRITLDRGLEFDHPATTTAAGTMTAEVLNLTRNVRIEGAPDGRAHVMIRSNRPQTIRFASLRHLGPRQASGGHTKGVLGRYGLHFHVVDAGSTGSLVEGVVITECGNHAFVPHQSHGIVFRDCISHDTYESAYWWDDAPDTRTPAPPTNSVTYQRCVASLVRTDPAFRGFRLSGFALGRGDGNVAIGCVATGVQGNEDANGFHWPEGSEGVWAFRDCIAHNNARHGIFVWQNTSTPHVIERFTAYHCGGFGVSHGAYRNPYRYVDSVLHGNRDGAIALHAKGPTSFIGIRCDGAGLSDFGVVAHKHTLNGTWTTFDGCSFQGFRRAALGFTYTGGNGASSPERVEIRGATFSGNELWLASEIAAESVIRLHEGGRSWDVRRRDQDGEYRPEWNASVRPAGP